MRSRINRIITCRTCTLQLGKKRNDNRGKSKGKKEMGGWSLPRWKNVPVKLEVRHPQRVVETTPQRRAEAATDTGETCTRHRVRLKHIEWFLCLSGNGARIDVVHGEVLRCGMGEVLREDVLRIDLCSTRLVIHHGTIVHSRPHMRIHSKARKTEAIYPLFHGECMQAVQVRWDNTSISYRFRTPASRNTRDNEQVILTRGQRVVVYLVNKVANFTKVVVWRVRLQERN